MKHVICEPCPMLTLESCQESCRQGGYALAGVEAGHECVCDNVLATPSPRATLSDCDSPCTGNASQQCGAPWRLFVYNATGPLPPPPPPPPPPVDSRDLRAGTVMLSTGYLDQPYCAKVLPHPRSELPLTWTCIITDGAVHEGGAGEHMVAVLSTDKGATWSRPYPIEPANNTLANSYGTIVVSPRGRLYCIYNYNINNVTRGPDGKPLSRTDELGGFFMRASDDAGRTWGPRVAVPYRETPVDRNNSYHGKTRIMWSVDQVKVRNGTSYHAFTKIGSLLQAPPEEVWILSSPNLLSDPPIGDVTWNLLPNGPTGILAPGALHPPSPVVMEEGHVLPLAQSAGFYAVGRTSLGFLAAAFTSDATAGSGWGVTAYAQYWDPTRSAHNNSNNKLVPQPGMRVGQLPSTGLKNPRGPITPKRMSNGIYLLLFYNNAGGGGYSRTARNPYWLAAGREVVLEEDGAGLILWSQPEVVLYNVVLDAEGGGYPDFIEDEGAVYITETQKSISRIHSVPDTLLQGLYTQHNISVLARDGLALTLTTSDEGKIVSAPALPPLAPLTRARQGFAFDLTLIGHADGAREGQVLLDTTTTKSSSTSATTTAAAIATTGGGGGATDVDLRASAGAGLRVSVGANASIVIALRDTKGVNATLATGATCNGMLRLPGQHYVAFVADAGPPLASVMVDGFLCDGGGVTGGGFLHLPRELGSVQGSSAKLAVAPSYGGKVKGGHIYTQMLRTSELVGNYRASLIATA